MSLSRAEEVEVKYDCFGEYWNRADKYKAIINPETNDLYAIVSSKYKILDNDSCMNAVMEAVKEFPELGAPDVEIKQYKKDARLRANFTFRDTEVKIKDDILNPAITMFNSYDGGHEFGFWFGCYRVICTNGLFIGEITNKLRHRHTPNLDLPSVIQMLSSGIEALTDKYNLWQKWYDTRINKEEVDEKLKALNFGETHTEYINEEVEISTGLTTNNPLTMWLLYNVVAQYVEHRVKSEMQKVRFQQQMQRTFYKTI